MGESIELPDVLQEIRGALHPSRLKLASTGITYKDLKTGLVDQLAAENIKRCAWLRRARGMCLRVTMIEGAVHKFDGLSDADFERLNSFIHKHFGMKLEKKDCSVKGWNWGTAKFSGNIMSFDVDNVPAFEVPLRNVSGSQTNKNEVTMEYHQNDDAQVSLMEMRFHIPPDASGEKDNAEEFQKNVLSQANVMQLSGECICSFLELQCLTPRGRYDIKLFPTYLQLHGKTFDYKIPYNTILRIFLLPYKDRRQMFFVISLDPPIKQGQTRYHFLIILFQKDEEEQAVELTLTEEDKGKYEGKLQEEMKGEMYEIISRIMKVLVGKKITVPGSFASPSGDNCVSCSYKAATGVLYPLEKGFIFVHKPPIHIRFDEVASLNFNRSSSSLRSFDFDVETKTGTKHTFNGIEKHAFGPLHEFVMQKKLRVQSSGGKDGKSNYADVMEQSDSGGEHDAYLEKMKREGRQRDDDDDSMDSDDEEFRASDLSASEVEEEFDSEYAPTDSSSSSEDAGEGSDAERRREEKRERREKKREEREKKMAKKAASRKKKPSGEDGASKKKTRTKKAKGDPNKPKRPQTAYFLWMAENRDRIRQENPSVGITDVSKIAGEEWRKLTDKDKAGWSEKSGEAKKEYEEKMKVYNQQLKDNPPPSDADNEESPPKKRKKPSSAAKKKPAAKEAVADASTKGTGASFKSKEYISSSESEAKGTSEDEDFTPSKKKQESDESPLPSSGGDE